VDEDTPILSVTEHLNTGVTALQTVIALILVVVLVIGVVNLISTFAKAALSLELLGYKNAITLVSTTIDIVLYLFIVIELYRTIIAYVEAESVVRAVIHAGLIAVVRQIIIFKPADAANVEEAFMTAGTYVLLLFGLLVGFYLVHSRGGSE
jgi:uncharacterized membrane protein (DUF373 family)